MNFMKIYVPNFDKISTFDQKHANNSKNNGLATLKPSSVPTNVMIAVILMGLLTSKFLSEAEIQVLQKPRIRDSR